MSEWKRAGKINLENDHLIPPPLPSGPGLYRLIFDDDSRYIGEASDINRRIGDYLIYHRSVGIESEFRINAKLRTSLNGTEVWVQTGEEYSDHSHRCIQEHQEIKAERAERKTVLNGGTIKEKIAFHEAEIARLRQKLALQQCSDGGSNE